MVILKDGCEAVISDDATNLDVRMLDVGKMSLEKVNIEQIELFYSLGVGWCKCHWH